MRKGIRAAIVGIAALCFLGDAAATTVLIFVSPEEAVIAADNLSNRIEGGQRLVCKVAQVSEHTLFVAEGIGSTENPRFDPYELAKVASTNCRNPREAAMKYASDAMPALQEIWRLNRSRILDIGVGNRKRPIAQDFTFVGLTQDGLISFSGSSFVEDAASPPRLRLDEIREVTGEHADEIFLYKAGVIGGLPSDDEISAWIKAVGAPAALKRAIEVQIKAAPELVGGEISVVRLRRDGSITWVDRGVCQERKTGLGVP